jgi:hypothetical protein
MRRMRCAVLLVSLLLAFPALAEREAPDEALRELVREAVAASESFDDRFDAEVWLVDMAYSLAARPRRFAISEAGALGLMQVMPFWLDELEQPEANLFRPRTNLRIGTTILRYYLEREQGNMRRALARYNGSLGENWYPDRVFRALNTRWAP